MGPTDPISGSKEMKRMAAGMERNASARSLTSAFSMHYYIDLVRGDHHRLSATCKGSTYLSCNQQLAVDFRVATKVATASLVLRHEEMEAAIFVANVACFKEIRDGRLESPQS